MVPPIIAPMSNSVEDEEAVGVITIAAVVTGIVADLTLKSVPKLAVNKVVPVAITLA